MAASEKAEITGAAQPGATITSIYAHRGVLVYAVFEHELDMLVTLNTLASTGASLCSFFAAAACGIWTNAAFVNGAMPTEGAILANFVAPMLLVASGIALIFSRRVCRRRTAVWCRIANARF
jgi:hypothetical protein